jgi:hypothetical protein
MSGRRGHQRLTVGSPADGGLRVRRDVVIERVNHEDLTLISQTPAVVGEEMCLELFSGSGCVALNVVVLDSHPILIAGSMRHRLLVAVKTMEAEEAQSTRAAVANSSATSDIA